MKKSKLFTENEAVSLRCVVDVLEKNGSIPRAFEPHVREARAKLNSDDPDLTASDAAGLCVATCEYLKTVPIESLPREVQVVFKSAYRKLISVQRDRPVFVGKEDGWHICVNGLVTGEPFESEERARFFWSIRPWPLN